MNISTSGPPLPLLRGSVPQSKMSHLKKGIIYPSVVSELIQSQECLTVCFSSYRERAIFHSHSATVATDKHQKNMTEATGSQWAAEVSEVSVLVLRQRGKQLPGW